MSLNSRANFAPHDPNAGTIKGMIEGKRPVDRSFTSLLGHMARPASVTTDIAAERPVRAMNPKARPGAPACRRRTGAPLNPWTRDTDVLNRADPLGVVFSQRPECGETVESYYRRKEAAGLTGMYDAVRTCAPKPKRERTQ